MELSERMFGLIDMCGGDESMIRGWADEVAQLEAETGALREGVRNAMNNIGVLSVGYFSPVAEAYDILNALLTEEANG